MKHNNNDNYNHTQSSYRNKNDHESLIINYIYSPFVLKLNLLMFKTIISIQIIIFMQLFLKSQFLQLPLRYES